MKFQLNYLRAVFGHEEEPLPWILCDEYVVEGFSKIVGARDGEVVLMNSLTVNVHVMLVNHICIQPGTEF